MSPPREVAIRGRRIAIDDDQPTFWDRVEAGTWEPGTLEVLESCLGPGRLFVDVGAWVGALTLHAAALGAEVVAVEADPRALDQFRRNLAVNAGLAGRIRIVPSALAGAGGPVRMGARRKPGDSMSSVLLANRGETWTAAGITARELASLVGGRPVDLLKIDIEGGEYALLPTLEPILEKASALLLALHPDILAASGNPEVSDTTRNTLEILDGWNVAGVGAAGPVPACHDDVAEAGPSEWLFTRERESAREGRT